MRIIRSLLGFCSVLLLVMAFSGAAVRAADEPGVSDTSAPTAESASPSDESEPAPSEEPAEVPEAAGEASNSADYLVNRTRGDGKKLGVIFADGPDVTWTPKILDLLKQNESRATFCIKGVDAGKDPSILRRIINEGHAVCNHTWKHDKPSDQSPEQLRQELTDTNAALRQAAGDPNLPIPYFLAPSSAYGEHGPAIAAELGMTSVATTIHPLDFDNSPAAVIAQRIRDQLHETGVVLTHDGIPNVSQTYAAYATLLPELRKQGWTLDLPAIASGLEPPHCTAPAWQWWTFYRQGDRVSHNGHVYQALRRVTVLLPPWQLGWLWRDLGRC